MRIHSLFAGAVLLITASCVIDVPDEDSSGVFRCSTPSDCLDGFDCVGGFCARAGDGDSTSECSVDAECDDGNACTADGCTDGRCSNVSRVGQSCTTQAITSGECVDAPGSPDCRWANGSPCTADEACASGWCNVDTCSSCDFDGDCEDGNACMDDACTGGHCEHTAVADGTACQVASPGDGACRADGHASTCLLVDGQACGSDATLCYSANCVDGVCCDTACAGECNRCDVDGSTGTCTPDDSACAGTCAVCTSGGACAGDASLCSGTCSACVEATSSFDCAADDSLCTEVCSECTGVGSAFDCTFDAGASAADCPFGQVCDDVGVCTSGIGGPCAAGGSDCIAGSCVGGFCCDTASSFCAIDVTAGTGFTCIADSTGDVQCWGNNVHEQLGHDTPGASAVPLAALQLGATALSDGSEHLCAVNGSGALECWGRGDRGQLGDGSVVDSSVPRQAFAGSVVEAATYGENTCARMQGGAVQCWGSNGSGQVGDVSLGDPVTTPSLVPNVSNATSITVGWGFACAVTGGEVVCWGDGGNGRLGNGSTSNVDAAAGPLTPVVGVSGAVAVGAGSEFACALLDSGAVSCWGRNQYGTLGVAPASMSSSATSVEVIDSGIVALAVGPTYACAIDTNEAIRCWGNNRDGQLGMAPGGIQSTPVTVQPPPDVGFRRVSAGTSHVCTRVTTGEVFCWGDNINGQLGNGEHVARMTPTEPIFAGAAVGTVCSGNQDCASGICPSVPSWPNRICLYDGAWCSASRADTSTFQEGTLTYGAGSFTVTGFDDTEGTVTDCPPGTTSNPATSTTISGNGCTVSVSALDDGCDFTVSGSGWTYVRGAWR